MPEPERPYGAAIDIKEVEYISALHQTSLPNLRKDGSISATDVRLYLRSKYGIKLSHDDALGIVRGLGGPTVRVEQIHPVERGIIEELENEAIKLERSVEGKDGNGRSSPNVTHKQARGVEDSLMEGAEKQYYFNLIQMISIIIIPALLQAAHDLHLNDQDEEKNTEQTPPQASRTTDGDSLSHYPANILHDVAQIMLQIHRLESQNVYDKLKTFQAGQAYNNEEESVEASLDSNSEFIAPDSPLPTVDEEFIRHMLMRCGEQDAAKNDCLVQEMVKAAGGPGVIFDEHALGRALTFDVSEWEIGAESDNTSTFLDVFGFELKNIDQVASNQEWNNKSMEGEKSKTVRGNIQVDSPDTGVELSVKINNSSKDKSTSSAICTDEVKVTVPHYKYRAACVDRAVDTYDSIWLEILLWLFYAFLSVVHVTALQAISTAPCTPSFGCSLLTSVVTFVLLGFVLCLFGLVVILPVSVGASARSPVIRVCTILLVLAYAITPLFWLLYYDENKLELKTLVTAFLYRLASFSAVALGCAVAVLLFVRLFPRTAKKRKQYIYFAAATKLAAVEKVHRLMNNALNLHYDNITGSRKSLSTNTLNNFLARGSSLCKCDGGLAIWKKVLSAELLKKEGVWIHSRLIVGQAGQIATCVFLITAWLKLINTLTEEIRSEREKFQDFPQILNRIPKEWMIVWSFYPGGCIAIYVGYCLIISYIPSTVNTILDLRSGLIPTLHDPKFIKYRKSADLIYFNLGNMIYAFLGSTLSNFLLYSLILFLCFWPPSQSYMSTVAAGFLGLFIITFLKIFLILFCRKSFYIAFYRKRPAHANISALMMEAWHLGLGGSVLVTRMFLFLIASGFWIGRIDETYLAENVNFKGWGFDTVPLKYRQELLVHDAHRHPFLERLGAMYLMRLKYGNNFSCDAGACWRSLFVIALMPWLLKYQSSGCTKSEKVD